MNSGNGRPYVLVIGLGYWPWYENALVEGLRLAGAHSKSLNLADWLMHPYSEVGEVRYRSTFRKFQARHSLGPIVSQMNDAVIRYVVKERPDGIVLYNTGLIRPSTVETFRTQLPESVIFSYVNDNPFAEKKMVGWRNVLEACSQVHHVYAFRPADVERFIAAGASSSSVLMPYFVPSIHHPNFDRGVTAPQRESVIFAGHYEDDGRGEALQALACSGVSLRIWGTGWEPFKANPSTAPSMKKAIVGSPVYGSAYQRAITSSCISIGFLSKRNQDVFTTRNFEIPAMKTPLITQRSREIEELFAEGDEILMFDNVDGLLHETHRLLGDKVMRAEMSDAALSRVWRDQHHAKGRADQVLVDLGKLANGSLIG